MSSPLLRVTPSRDDRRHSRIHMSVEVSQPLSPLELADLAQALRRWTGQTPRFALCAGEELEWLEQWSDAVHGALGHLVQVEFHTRLQGGRGPHETEPF
jgi:hypothetical protein